MPHPAARITRMHPANDWHFLHNWQHLELANLHCYCIRIPIGHQPGSRSMPGHAKPSGIINNDYVSTALLDKFGADPSPGARRDNGLAFPERVAQPLNDFFARVDRKSVV